MAQPNAHKRSRQNNQPQAELLQAVLDRVRIREWDLLLIGDGSGSGWDGAAGWASTLINRWTRDRFVFFGGANVGSVNFAEMMPYFQALIWYHNHAGKDEVKKRGLLNVHVITDSAVTVNHGAKAAQPGQELPKVPQRALWAGMRELGHMGYCLHWHWAERSTNSLNFLADLIAALARRQILLLGQDISLPDNGELAQRAAEALAEVRFVDPVDGEPIDVHALNPA
jgi:ribonuclease HI